MPKPVFADLSARETAAVLRRNHVGRLAFMVDGHVDIAPVHYSAARDWIYVRSAAGAKLDAFTHHPYVAFEVDEIEGPADWRSVVVHGTIYWMEQTRTPAGQKSYEQAIDALRSVNPALFTARDLTPFRQTVYGVHIDRMTGRAASLHAPSRKSRRPLPTPKPRPARSRSSNGT